MKRNQEARKVVDLGAASRETKGNGISLPDHAGLKPAVGLSND